MPIDELIDRQVLLPLGMISTMLPRGDDRPRGRLTPEYKSRAVQGYSDDSEPIGQPGEQTSYYHWPGTGQMYSSPRVGGSARLRDLRTYLLSLFVYRRAPNRRQATAWYGPAEAGLCCGPSRGHAELGKARGVSLNDDRSRP